MGDERNPVDAREPRTESPMAAWFLGPKAEHGQVWLDLIRYIFNDYIHWRRNYFPNDPIVITRERQRAHERWFDLLNSRLDAILNALKAHYPFYSPRYIAHMLSEQTLPSVLGYFAGMLYNPNNVTDEAAPVTVALELEVGRLIAEMLGYQPMRAWAHLTSGGTVANVEALWIARSVQFTPLALREYCSTHSLGFTIKTPSGQTTRLVDVDDGLLLNLRPNEAIFMPRKLAAYLVHDLHRSANTVLRELNDAVATSSYNISREGVAPVMNRIGMRPEIFVSAAAHYSIKKAANLLGYGENSVQLVPVTGDFRVNVAILRERLFDLPRDRFIAAVVAIAGTTEEGAVDPVHTIRFLRDDLSRLREKSFWLHVDGAWGGYIASLFRGHNMRKRRHGTSLAEICQDYEAAIDAKEKLHLDFVKQTKRKGVKYETRAIEVRWNDPEVYSAYLALPDADSITIDPHKLGYIPYPCGAIAFRNGVVTEFVTQRAQYISDVGTGFGSIDAPPRVTAVGPYILEGSKPGAAAAACWLAHKTIPLTAGGHGKVIKTSLLNAKKLHKYLQHHASLFETLEHQIFDGAACLHPFSFTSLFVPDSNIVCFIAVPMMRQKGTLTRIDTPLQWLNRLNELVYASLSIPPTREGPQLPYAQPYFVSRTRIEASQYPAGSVKGLLERLGITGDEYTKFGIFVLRSTVMNPFYYTAEAEGKNYLYGFLQHIHRVARSAMATLYEERTRRET